MKKIVVQIGVETYGILMDSSFYILVGIIIAGFLKVGLSKNFISDHLGKGRFSSVFKAAILGIPLPL